MKKEFGKWLMDVAKYVLTAILLTTVFGGMENNVLIFVLGVVIVGITLGWGPFHYSYRDGRWSIFHNTRPSYGT